MKIYFNISLIIFSVFFNSTKADFAFNKKQNLGYLDFNCSSNEHSNFPVIFNDSPQIFQKRLLLYNKSKNKFVRTNYINNNVSLEKYISRTINERGLDGNDCIKELYSAENDIVYYYYFKPYLSKYMNGFDHDFYKNNQVLLNDNKVDGLGYSCNVNITQQLSHTFLTRKGSVINFRDKILYELIPPESNLSTYNIQTLPLFEISPLTADRSWYSYRERSGRAWGMSDEQWYFERKSYSKPILNVVNNKLLTLPVTSNQRILNFQYTDNFMVLGVDKLFNRDLVEIAEIDNDENKKLLTFNDSFTVYLLDSGISIHKIYDSQYSEVVLFDISTKNDIYFAQIDKANKFLYVEYRNLSKYNLNYNIWISDNKKSKISKDLLLVIDLQKNNIVFLGPSLNIDYLDEKIGHIMTAIEKNDDSKEKVIYKTQKPVDRIKTKLPSSISFINNNDWFIHNDRVEFDGKNHFRNVKSFKRNLINLTSYLNDSFYSSLVKTYESLKLTDDIFMRSYVSFQNQFIFDSLTLYGWQNIKSPYQLMEYERNFKPSNQFEDFKFDSLLNKISVKSDGEDAMRNEEFSILTDDILRIDTFYKISNQGYNEKFVFKLKSLFVIKEDSPTENSSLLEGMFSTFNCMCSGEINPNPSGPNLSNSGRYKDDITFHFDNIKYIGKIELDKSFIEKKDSNYILNFTVIINAEEEIFGKKVHALLSKGLMHVSINEVSSVSFPEHRLDSRLLKELTTEEELELIEKNLVLVNHNLFKSCGLEGLRYKLKINYVDNDEELDTTPIIYLSE